MNLIQEMHTTSALDAADVILSEDVSWDVGRPLEQQLAQSIRQYEAALRALSIVNSFKDPATRKKHKSRVMGMLNKLRASTNRLHTAIEGELQAMEQDSL